MAAEMTNQSYKVVVYRIGLPAVEFRLDSADTVSVHDGILCIEIRGNFKRCFVVAYIEGWSVELAS